MEKRVCMTVKPLKKRRIPEVARVYEKAYKESCWNENWKYCDVNKRLTEMLASGQYKSFALYKGNNIIGCAICEILTWHTGRQLEIKELFIEPKEQSSGAGEKLMNHIEKYSRDRGVSEICLWTGKNTELISFYKKMGYTSNPKTIQFTKKMEHMI